MLQAARIKLLPFAVLLGITVLGACAAPPPPRVVVAPPPPPHHPAYLHALSDLRAARWLIEHRPGDWVQTNDEMVAIQQIDGAINDIKKAAYDDGKNLNDHPPLDTHPDNRGRIHQALGYLGKARADIAREEDNAYADGLRDRAIKHIDAASQAAHRVFND
jgi:hypothetical protein